MKTKKIALITGATSGIGKACAEKFGANGYDLIITGRREKRLDEISKQLKNKFNTDSVCLCFDITKYIETEKAISSLTGRWKKIDVLVNNAGLAAGLGPIDEGKIADWEIMIDTNIKGLLYVSRLVIPIMVKHGKGHVINIGSIAGKETYINGNIYCATKHAVDSLTKAMRMDLLKHGIKVSAVNPGAVETEFALVRFKGDKAAAKNVYKGYKPLTGKDVAEVVYFTTTLPDHVNINDVIVTPTAQANTVHTFRKDQ